MRITNSMIAGHFMYNLNRNLNRMDSLQMQMTSGKKFTRPSDDPIGITRSLQLRTDLSKIRQHQANVKDAKAWLNETETALMEMKEIIHRVNELTIYGANGSLSDSDRNATAMEVDQLKQQLVQTGNTTFAGRYIFGGYNTNDARPPFVVDETTGKLKYNNEDLSNFPNVTRERIEYELGDGVKMEISFPGADIFCFNTQDPNSNDPNLQVPHYTNLFEVIDVVYQQLSGGNADQNRLDTCIKGLNDGLESILSHLADVGGKSNRLDLMETRLIRDEDNYEGLRSEVEDIDQERVIMDFKMAEAVYRSALAVGARIIQPSLVDFLR